MRQTVRTDVYGWIFSNRKRVVKMFNVERRLRRKKINRLSKYIEKRLLDIGCILHKHKSVRTDSIYLKINYGMGGTIRLSDHPSNKQLSYRFTLLMDQTDEGISTIQEENCKLHTYKLGILEETLEVINQYQEDVCTEGSTTLNIIEELIKDINNYKDHQVIKYGGLQKCLSIGRTNKKWAKTNGFWLTAYEVRTNTSVSINMWLKIKGVKYRKMAEIVDTVREENTKLDTVIMSCYENSWENLPVEYLDSILARFQEIQGIVEVTSEV